MHRLRIVLTRKGDDVGVGDFHRSNIDDLAGMEVLEILNEACCAASHPVECKTGCASVGYAEILWSAADSAGPRSTCLSSGWVPGRPLTRAKIGLASWMRRWRQARIFSIPRRCTAGPRTRWPKRWTAAGRRP